MSDLPSRKEMLGLMSTHKAIFLAHPPQHLEQADTEHEEGTGVEEESKGGMKCDAHRLHDDSMDDNWRQQAGQDPDMLPPYWIDRHRVRLGSHGWPLRIGWVLEDVEEHDGLLREIPF